jgi:ribonucleoside-diphosphate reductase alpha chain
LLELKYNSGGNIVELNQWLETKLQQDIWQKKYCSDNETLDQWFDRISNKNENIKKLIIEKKFLFGGRILASRGLQNKGKKITLSNCYVLTPPEDNIESIFDCAKKLARTYSYGGGVGIDISKLSPKGSKINNAAKETTGSVSFMDLYSLVTELIGQSGRRGALMISIDCTHPDLLDFINIKSNLNKVTKANISIKINDDFMKAVENDEDWVLSYIRNETGEKIETIIKAKELMRKFAEMNWDYSEPGLLNWSRITEWNLLSEDKNFEYAGVNPCAKFFGSSKKLDKNGEVH